MNTVLQKRISEGRLPNPLLLIGPKKTVNRDLVVDLVKQILGETHIAKIDSGNHPDIHWYSPEGKSALHCMANIQKLIAETAFPPFEAEYSIFILEDAEKMLNVTSNALLKTLEEPSPRSFLILLTENPDALLPTVRSRLHFFQFSSLSMQILPEIQEKVDHFIHLVKEGIWEQFFKEISTLETVSSDSILETLLLWIKDQKIPNLFPYIKLVDEAQMALRHNVKWRNVLIHLLIKMGTIQRNFPTHPNFVRSVEK